MIVNIQMLRFLAALAVFMAHLSERFHGMAAGADLFVALSGIGRAGVDVFFVISGYIMWTTTRDLTGGRASLRFLLRRFARIYSGYWPFFMLFLFAFWVGEPSRLTNVDTLKSFFLVPQGINHHLIAVAWTLSYELYFYLLISVLLLFSRRTAAGLMVLIAVVVLAMSIYLQITLSRGQLVIFSYIGFITSPFVLEFLAGCWVASLTSRGPVKQPQWWLVAGLIVVAVAGWFNLTVYDDGIFYGFHRLERVLLFGSASVLIVYGLIGLEQSGYYPRGRLFLELGGASYALYLGHTLFIGAFSHLFYPSLVGVGVPIASMVYLLIMVVVLVFSIVVYRWIENPLHRWSRDLVLRYA
ncbi:MAG: acyltransferase family protein [bacterium]